MAKYDVLKKSNGNGNDAELLIQVKQLVKENKTLGETMEILKEENELIAKELLNNRNGVATGTERLTETGEKYRNLVRDNKELKEKVAQLNSQIAVLSIDYREEINKMKELHNEELKARQKKNDAIQKEIGEENDKLKRDLFELMKKNKSGKNTPKTSSDVEEQKEMIKALVNENESIKEDLAKKLKIEKRNIYLEEEIEALRQKLNKAGIDSGVDVNINLQNRNNSMAENKELKEEIAKLEKQIEIYRAENEEKEVEIDSLNFELENKRDQIKITEELVEKYKSKNEEKEGEIDSLNFELKNKKDKMKTTEEPVEKLKEKKEEPLTPQIRSIDEDNKPKARTSKKLHFPVNDTPDSSSMTTPKSVKSTKTKKTSSKVTPKEPGSKTPQPSRTQPEKTTDLMISKTQFEQSGMFSKIHENILLSKTQSSAGSKSSKLQGYILLDAYLEADTIYEVEMRFSELSDEAPKIGFSEKPFSDFYEGSSCLYYVDISTGSIFSKGKIGPLKIHQIKKGASFKLIYNLKTRSVQIKNGDQISTVFKNISVPIIPLVTFKNSGTWKLSIKNIDFN